MIQQSFEENNATMPGDYYKNHDFGTPEQSKGLVRLLGHMNMITLSEVY